MTNFQYMQTLPLDLFHAVVGGLMGLDYLSNPHDANEWLFNWLQSDIDEGFCKDELLAYCEIKDRENNLLLANQRLKDNNKYLVKEISKLARESIKRDKALAKLETEVIGKIKEPGTRQVSFDEYFIWEDK